ncbi:MAG TPA: hypothetical protein VJS69_12410, partial [Candidatus Krumholzibacteria bacterium]|nr:hypothetical protein [Candidatus Krumholzibacteria bacterium]
MPRPAELASVIDAEIAGIGDAIDVPILIVGADGALVRFNRAAREALGLVPSDIGRRPGGIGALAGIEDLDAQCARAIADEVTLRRDV